MNQIPFTLLSHQVPEPPKSSMWVDILRWTVCVMDPSDTRLAFLASCLSHAIKNEGLTTRQAAACQKIFDRVLDEHRDRTLICQNTTQDDEMRDAVALSVIRNEDGA